MKDGGPAFPSTEYYENQPIGTTQGMSLRDYFAAHETSLPPKAWLRAHYGTEDLEESGVLKHEALSKWRYEMADAMLAARKSS